MRVAGLRPGAPVLARMRLDFAKWIARIGTPDADARAIRTLQSQVPDEVRAHFAIEADGSFTIDTMILEAGL